MRLLLGRMIASLVSPALKTVCLMHLLLPMTDPFNMMFVLVLPNALPGQLNPFDLPFKKNV